MRLTAKMLRASNCAEMRFLGKLEDHRLLDAGVTEIDLRKVNLGPRSSVDRWLHNLRDWGIIEALAGGGNHWRFRVANTSGAFADWWATHPASDTWPKFFPLMYDELREQFPHLPQEVFDARVRESLISALAADDNPIGPTQILAWVKRGLDRPQNSRETKSKVNKCQKVTKADQGRMYRNSPLAAGHPLMRGLQPK